MNDRTKGQPGDVIMIMHFISTGVADSFINIISMPKYVIVDILYS